MPKPRTCSAMLFVAFLFCSVIASSAQSTFFTSLASFNGTDGAGPEAGLVQAADGNFYGTTAVGGFNNCYRGCGTVFKITPNGTLTTLYSFCAQGGYCADGENPTAGLVQASDGNFYGTTHAGGGNFASFGTVFKITPTGTLTTLHSFLGDDGSWPRAGLIQASDGNFYGTTESGGANNGECNSGCGTVFKITPSGTLTTLHSFDGADGFEVNAGLVQASDGNFYGTTIFGGDNGFGTVFKVTPSGTLTTLHSFDLADGAATNALVQASDGNFYGTTQGGGGFNNCHQTNGCGTVFKITPSGTLTTLYSFCAQGGYCADGENPTAGLVQASDGNFYGTTAGGGAPYGNYGTVFKITSSGTLTTLHNFDGIHGATPLAGLVQAHNGFFYGTAAGGGAYGNYGTVFRLGMVRSCAPCRP